MQITFWREGNANNSSSSHSIIFAKDNNLVSDEHSQFGCEYFTAADKQSKLNYALICLYSTWRRFNDMGWNHANINPEDLKHFYQDQFRKWLPKQLHPSRWVDVFEGFVDHQSNFTFPSYRDVGRGVNIDFAIEWITELMKDEYVILGGNDNNDGEHQSKELSSGTTDLIMVYNQLCGSYGLNNIAVKDELTKEWLISLEHGGLIKFKFSE